MSEPRGYGLWWRNHYVLSVSTAGRADGTHDVYLHSVGADTHMHIWARIEAGRVIGGGWQMKDQGEHLGQGGSFESHSTEPFARAHLKWDAGAVQVACELADTWRDSALTAGATFGRRRSSHNPERFDLGSSATTDIDCSFALVDAGSWPSSTSLPPGSQLLNFGGGSPLGILVQSSATTG